MSFDPYQIGSGRGAGNPPAPPQPVPQSSAPQVGQPQMPPFGSPTVPASSAAPGFGPGGSQPAFEVARPPLAWLVGALALGAAAALGGAAYAMLRGFGDSLLVGAAAWLCAGPAAIALLATFTLLDTGRRANPFYASSSSAQLLYWVALGIALLGVVVASVHLAFWAGRL